MTGCITVVLLSIVPAAPALGPPKFESVDDLLVALRSDRASRRRDAIEHLVTYPHVLLNRLASPDVALLADELLNHLGDRDHGRSVLESMHGQNGLSARQREKLAAALPILFKGEDASIRLDAAKLLVAVRPEDLSLALPVARAVMVEKGEPDGRVTAAKLVARWSPAEKPAAVKAVRSVLAVTEGWPRMLAANALIGMKEIDRAEWVNLIVGAIESSKDGIDRGNIVDILTVGSWPEARTAVPAVAKLLKDPEPYARVKGAAVLLRLDPSRRDEVVAVARELLTNKHECASAAALIGGIGSEARIALPDLRAALKDAPVDGNEMTVYTRVQLLRAMASVDSATTTDVVRELAGLLDQKSWFVKSAAILALAKCGPAAKESLPGLLRLTSDKKQEGTFVAELCLAFGAIGPAAHDALPILRRWAEHEFEHLRANAAKAIEQIEGKKER